MDRLLSETEKFINGVQDLDRSPTQAQTDERLIKLAEPILVFYHLADAIPILAKKHTPSLTPRLRQLAEFRASSTEHEHQFQETAYEIYCASQFALAGYSPAFVDPGQRSHYIKRVEFLVRHKWSVECKRPRSEGRILANIRAACAKIDERAVPGIVCVALENALPGNYSFWELLNADSIRAEVKQRVNRFLNAAGSDLMAIVSNSQAVGLLLNYTALCYNHKEETFEFPRLQAAILRNGSTVSRNVIAKLVEQLDAMET